MFLKALPVLIFNSRSYKTHIKDTSEKQINLQNVFGLLKPKLTPNQPLVQTIKHMHCEFLMGNDCR